MVLLLGCLCLAATARAATLRIGGTDIPYAVPPDYVSGDDGPYQHLLDLAAKAQPADIRILALYVSADSHQKFLKSKADLDTFLTISTSGQLEKRTLGPKDFARLRKAIISLQSRKKAEVESQAKRLIDSASQGNLGLGGLDFLGCSDDGPTRFSCLSVITQLDRADGKEHSYRQAALSTWLLSHGKLLMINQYQRLDPDRDQSGQVDAFRHQAQEVLKALRMPEDAARTGFFSGTLGRILPAAVVGGLIGGLFTLYRKKKSAV